MNVDVSRTHYDLTMRAWYLKAINFYRKQRAFKVVNLLQFNQQAFIIKIAVHILLVIIRVWRGGFCLRFAPK